MPKPIKPVTFRSDDAWERFENEGLHSDMPQRKTFTVMICAPVLAVLATLAILAVAGCEQPNRSQDGYYFEGGTWNCKRITVDLFWYQSKADLERAAIAAKARFEKGTLYGWGKVAPTCHCEAHLIDPKVRWDSAAFGHEGLHCAKGDWHPQQTAQALGKAGS